MAQPIPLRPAPDAWRDAQRRWLTRACTGHAIAYLRGYTMPETVIREAWPHDDEAIRFVRKASVDPPIGTNYKPTGTPAGIGEWPAITVYQFLDLIAYDTAGARLFRRAVQLDLEGRRVVRLPTLPPSGRPNVLFVAENASAPMLQLTSTNSDEIGPPCKLLVFAALTRELEALSLGAASELIGQALALQVGLGIDIELFSTNAPGAANPGGILHGVTASTASTATDIRQKVADDLGTLAAAIAAGGYTTHGLTYIAAPSTAMKLACLVAPQFHADHEVLESAAVPVGTLIAVQPAALVTAHWGADVTVDTAKDATVIQDTAPPNLIIGPGPAPAVGTVSLWQSDQFAVRARGLCAWCARTGSVAFMNNITW
jgi:hypothetical protein